MTATHLTRVSQYVKVGRNQTVKRIRISRHLLNERLSSYLRATRQVLGEILRVDLVHFVEIVHVVEEDVDLDDFLEAAAGGFEDGGQIANNLMLMVEVHVSK